MMKKILIISLFLIVIIAVLYYPGKIPYSLRLNGRIFPCKELVVTQSDDGRLRAILLDNILGTRDYTLYTEFQRGYVVKFKLHHSIVPGFSVALGDTIGWIDSNEFNLQLAELSTELRMQKASLRVAEAGEKESVIKEAEKSLAQAREQLETQINIVERQKKLYDKNIITDQDYEILLSTQKLYSINVEIAEAQLLSLSTGVKQEEIDMISSIISGLEEEINTLRSRFDEYTILSPLSGIVLSITNSDTLLNIGDISSFAVKIPLKLSNRYHVDQQEVECTVEGINTPLCGRISQIGNVVQLFNGEQFLLATAGIEPQNSALLPGTFTRCRIVCEPVELREYIIRIINNTLTK